MRKLIIGVAAAAGFAVGPAGAASINTTTAPFLFTDGAAPTFGGTFNVGSFDSNLGTLLSATFSIEGIVGTSGAFTNGNTSGDPITVTLVQTAQIEADGPDLFGLSTGGFVNPADSQTVGPLAPGASAPYSLEYSISNSGNITDLAGVTTNGPGSFSVTYTLFSTAAPATSVSNGSLTFITAGSFEGLVTYEYEVEENVIPVPAALPLLATALGALGVYRIRRKA